MHEAMHPERTGPAAARTGDPRVDQAIAELSSIAGTDLDERPAILAGVHDRLREILGELAEAGQPGAPGRHGEQRELGR